MRLSAAWVYKVLYSIHMGIDCRFISFVQTLRLNFYNIKQVCRKSYFPFSYIEVIFGSEGLLFFFLNENRICGRIHASRKVATIRRFDFLLILFFAACLKVYFRILLRKKGAFRIESLMHYNTRDFWHRWHISRNPLWRRQNTIFFKNNSIEVFVS